MRMQILKFGGIISTLIPMREDDLSSSFPRKYLIEQVQMQEGITVPGFGSHTLETKLRFNHPVKELIWTSENLVGDAGEVEMKSASGKHVNYY